MFRLARLWFRVRVPVLAAGILSSYLFWAAQVAHAAGLVQGGEEILTNPLIVSLAALLASGPIVVVVTAYLRKFGITLGLKPERLVLVVSFAISLAINATSIGLPQWVTGGDWQAYITSWTAWVNLTQKSAQMLYEMFMAKLPDLIVPPPAPEPPPVNEPAATTKMLIASAK